MTLSIIGKYELKSLLGHGAFGEVYLAHDMALDAIKAIKVLNAEDAYDVKQKLEEAQILHKCKHKNIVHVNEANVYEVNNTPRVIIDMEYLPNGSFENAISSNTVSVITSVRYIIDCLFALEHAHINGILHRDVKPANIMISNFGAKLSDFGLATVLGVNVVGSDRGYTTHLPPEYFTSHCTTELTDIFAVGVTLFRACNYISDWDGVVRKFSNPINLIETGYLISSIGYAPFIPQKLKRIINKACAANPYQRYQSAADFRQALVKLSPCIDWVPSSNSSFTGKCCRSGDIYSIVVTANVTAFNVDVRRNNRRQGSDCKSFGNLNDANQYLFRFVSTSLYN